MISNNAIVPALAPHESPKAHTLPETLPSQESPRSRHNRLRHERWAQQRATTAPLPDSPLQGIVPQEECNERWHGRRAERRGAASVITSMAFLNIQPATSMAALDFHDNNVAHNNVAHVTDTTNADTAPNVTAAEQPAPSQFLATLPPTNIER
ncbi:unnamed protein product [Sphagnum troendelagicum]|uniref:Uncharacterized protein n=1 Tax=Sphagnum troendelagicum TaxID=128251 RepID=A0ABP0UY04_9BRYO